MTPLVDLLARRIADTGPITIATFMAECLMHPTHGYYTTAPVFGREGDFTTAPEISQMFGELVGLSLAGSWLDQGQPTGASLVEIGPGRGTLMADLLRATRAVPGFQEATNLRLIETSPRLRELQKQALCGFAADWADSVDALPQAPLFLVANEFLDALPIRQLVRCEEGWRERLIGMSVSGLQLCLSDPLPAATLQHRIDDTRPGDVVELCPALPAVIFAIADRIATHGGAAILIDYGHWHSHGDTFQALRDHKPVDPLDGPGTADLTAHVDFEAVAQAATAAGANVSDMTPQGIFLERLGITARAQALARNMKDEAQLQSHIAAHRRLTHPQEMGSLFKVIAIHAPGTAPPPGFDT